MSLGYVERSEKTLKSFLILIREKEIEKVETLINNKTEFNLAVSPQIEFIPHRNQKQKIKNMFTLKQNHKLKQLLQVTHLKVISECFYR